MANRGMLKVWLGAVVVCCVGALPSELLGQVAAPAADNQVHPGAAQVCLVMRRQPQDNNLSLISGRNRLGAIVGTVAAMADDWTRALQGAGSNKGSTAQLWALHAGGDAKQNWKQHAANSLELGVVPAGLSASLYDIRQAGGLDDARADRLLALWGISNVRRLDVEAIATPAAPTAKPDPAVQSASSPRLALRVRVAPQTIPPEGDHERPFVTISSDAELPAGIREIANRSVWHLWFITDAKGLGSLGPRGGVGSLAGVTRLLGETRYVTGPESDEQWSARFSAWRNESDDAIRVINQSCRQEILVAGMGGGVAVAGGDDLAGGGQSPGEEPGVLVVLPMRDGASTERVQQAVGILARQMGLGDTWTKTPGATMLQGTMSGELVNQPQRKLPVAIGLVSASNAAQVKYVWIGLGTAASQKAQEWVK